MNAVSKCVVAVLGLACVFSISLGGQFIGAALWWHAVAMYVVGGACLAGISREISRSVLPGEYTDDLPEDQPAETVPASRPPRMGRRRAARAARREVRTVACCDRYWTSLGAAHDTLCTRSRRSPA
ncbi:hypothetical protein [Streptomyces sp. AMCC400023]|uniref:hypothetical protein n=1 Tax=Streptomyces sp. AMCC400023 TaxID=2056258 RepID=UPI001F3AF959|nr:hypothetical protein [Streptomyces sp. AMCC400023]UJV42935.1 hypothetical protein CVT30_26610 [Streptomyces sp. AMCC400023]